MAMRICFSADPRSISRREWIKLAGTSLLFASACFPASDLRRIPPVDESERDESLQQFLSRLRGIVLERQSTALEHLLGPSFKVEFGLGKGPVVFRQHWRSESDSSPVWNILERILSLGGTFYSETLFAVPYVYTRFPVDMDLLGHIVATTEMGIVFETPNLNSGRPARLDYSILPLTQRFVPPVIIKPDQFLQVDHPEFGRCYVAGTDVYSPVGHRAFFEKKNGQWTWLSLVAGSFA
jgi:hypothetical protein